MTLDEVIKKAKEDSSSLVIEDSKEVEQLIRELRELKAYKKLMDDSKDKVFTIIAKDERGKKSMAAFMGRCMLSVTNDTALRGDVEMACLDTLKLLQDSIIVWNPEI